MYIETEHTQILNLYVETHFGVHCLQTLFKFLNNGTIIQTGKQVVYN
jgi:hypothetical protein